MEVTHVSGGDLDQRWATYVASRATSVTDLAEWRAVLYESYGIKAHFLAALDGANVIGALALYEIRHPVFGHYLTTAAFGNDGGLFADDAPTRDALATEARTLATTLGVAYLVIRTRELELPGFRVDCHYRSAVLDLHEGADAVWKAFPSTTRNQIRRGMKEGFTVSTGRDQLDAFFDVFHRHMRDLGSPAHAHAFYESISRHLSGAADFCVVRDGAGLVAGALLFHVNGTAMNLHTVSLREYNRRCANYLIYWNMIEASCTRGCHAFDMGRSEAGSSNLDFKSNWNPREVTLTYNYFLVRAKEMPYLDPRNPKYQMAIAAWQKLPVAVTKALGPRLISGLA